jgi:subtilase family serine protease
MLCQRRTTNYLVEMIHLLNDNAVMMSARNDISIKRVRAQIFSYIFLLYLYALIVTAIA